MPNQIVRLWLPTYINLKCKIHENIRKIIPLLQTKYYPHSLSHLIKLDDVFQRMVECSSDENFLFHLNTFRPNARIF